MEQQYGFWAYASFDILVVGWAATGLFHPRSRQDWKALGGLWAFIVALFAEMYGFPLTLYLLEGPLGAVFPQLRLTFGDGHLWGALVGWSGNPELSPFVLVSYPVLVAGFWLTGAGWSALWRAVQEGNLATTGPYRALRHPQYAGFGLVMVGFLLQWPTIPTALMAPLLIWLYWRLGHREEAHQRSVFGQDWDRYAAEVPALIPRWRRLAGDGWVWISAAAATQLVPVSCQRLPGKRRGSLPAPTGRRRPRRYRPVSIRGAPHRSSHSQGLGVRGGSSRPRRWGGSWRSRPIGWRLRRGLFLRRRRRR